MDDELDPVEFFEKSSRRKIKFKDTDGKIEERLDSRNFDCTLTFQIRVKAMPDN